MIVIVVENVKSGVRGELSRWLFEVRSGVFVGRVSGLVREELWGLVGQQLGKGSALMIYPQRNEQGFGARVLGNPSRVLEDVEGVLLVRSR